MALGATEERNRLARDIHDTLAQGLSGIILQLETADALLEDVTDAASARTMLQRALESARHNLDEARRSVLDLRAAPLEGRTLSEAVEALVKTQFANTDITIDLSLGENRALPARIEVGLFRIAQEAITNVIKHSCAKHLTVRLNTTPQRVVMMIEDDGCGFDTDTIQKGHFGLIGMQERVRLLNGTFEISSCPETGTSLHITVPLEG